MPTVSLQDHPFRIRPGDTVDLNTLPTKDETLFRIKRDEGEEIMKDFAKEIDELQTRIYAENKQRILVIFQAMDTGGKDGAIRSVFDKMDPQGIRVASFKRPSAAELAHDYLWRVHQQVPQNGEVVIFNRSHYEDILAVRVRGIFPETRWSKRYEHILHFEQMLADEGTTIIKFFLNISRDEQKKRLQARLDDTEKLWKFNPGDLDDRALWPQFMEAYSDVFSKTSSESAPWYVVPADDKWQRDLIVADILIKTLRALDMKYPSVEFDPKAITIE